LLDGIGGEKTRVACYGRTTGDEGKGKTYHGIDRGTNEHVLPPVLPSAATATIVLHHGASKASKTPISCYLSPNMCDAASSTLGPSSFKIVNHHAVIEGILLLSREAGTVGPYA